MVPGLFDAFATQNNQAQANAHLYMGVTSIVALADARRGPLFLEADPSPRLHRLEVVTGLDVGGLDPRPTTIDDARRRGRRLGAEELEAQVDARAREVARRAVDRGFDQQFPEMHRWFFYLPFEHSEDAADQALSVDLFSRLSPSEANRMGLDFAVRHQRVIERFGRFPNRNAALGRSPTAEEETFLREQGRGY